jgi:hypothetical protein
MYSLTSYSVLVIIGVVPGKTNSALLDVRNAMAIFKFMSLCILNVF